MHKKRILIVEDEESLLKLETILLTVKGYEVRGALTGEEAMKILAVESFNLILLDIMLPDGDGFDICRQIKDSPDHVSVPVVMLTARKSPEDKDRGVAAGASAYLTKPFKSAVIVEVIEQLIAGTPVAGD